MLSRTGALHFHDIEHEKIQGVGDPYIGSLYKCTTSLLLPHNWKNAPLAGKNTGAPPVAMGKICINTA